MSSPHESVLATPTFLFSDIEGSTRLVAALGQRYAALLDAHRELITAAVEAAGGRVFGTEGDAVFCAFPTAGGAVAAAVDAQRAIAAHEWPEDGVIRVRMGIHSGEAMLSGGDYVGLAVHQVARIMSAGHGGQVLVSESARRLLSALPAGVELRDLGERRLKDLASAERIHQLVIEGLDDHFPPLRTLDTRANNLPTQLTSFVGRAELASARAALDETRLLTLSGPGGTGKTRLALQLAADASDHFDDGVYFVALDSITDPRLVAPAIASTLGLSVAGSVAPLDAVIAELREKRVLLVLDNFEQVVDAGSDVNRLLREAPHVKVIVTTRIVLRVSGERELPVPPLGMPPANAAGLNAEAAAQYEAVELFAERARAVQPQFTLTDENAPLVVEIVRRLDGLPLAIELAAARTRTLPVAAIHARLGQHLALLTGGSRDLPGRQQTLRGAIDWSYDLLEAPDRRLFERFSVHSGGAFLTQADAVCGPPIELGEEVLDGLSSLADKSLVKPDYAAAEDPRFGMLVTIRDYALERLEKAPDHADLARRHALVYLELAERLEPELIGPNARSVADRMELDHDNIRAGLDWAMAEQEVEIALRYIVAVWRFWQTRGHLTEARRRVDAVIAMAGVDQQPAAMRARALGAAGGVTYWQADVRATHRYYAQALEAARESGDKRLLAEALYNYSFSPLDQDVLSNEMYVAGEKYARESLEIYRSLGDDKGIGDASWSLSQGIAASGNYAEAAAYGNDALATFRRMGDPFRIGWGLFMLAGLELRQGRLEVANDQLLESLHIFSEARDISGILFNLAAFVLIASERGDLERANRLGGAVETLRSSSGAGLIDEPPDFINFSIPKRPTDDPQAEAWWDQGGHMSPEEATAYALEGAAADK